MVPDLLFFLLYLSPDTIEAIFGVQLQFSLIMFLVDSNFVEWVVFYMVCYCVKIISRSDHVILKTLKL